MRMFMFNFFMSPHIYPEIENSYRDKFIYIALELYPELKDEEFIIQEKIHGSNFSVEFLKDGTVKYYKRTGEIKPDEKFYNWKQPIGEMADLHVIMKNLAYKNQTDIILHGELFGKGVQKGIEYSPDKQRILFYDMQINNNMVSQEGFYITMKENGLIHYMIPTITIINGLRNALDFPETFKSLIYPSENDNIAEGIVIKPYKKVYWINDNIFYLKKKPPMWQEIGKKNASTEKKELKPQSPMLDYINDNRRDSVLSKLKPFTNKNQIGKYAPLIVEDAEREYLKDHVDVDLKPFRAQHMSMAARLLLKLL
jgi:Rnl2 family RNA ligase